MALCGVVRALERAYWREKLSTAYSHLSFSFLRMLFFVPRASQPRIETASSPFGEANRPSLTSNTLDRDQICTLLGETTDTRDALHTADDVHEPRVRGAPVGFIARGTGRHTMFFEDARPETGLRRDGSIITCAKTSTRATAVGTQSPPYLLVRREHRHSTVVPSQISVP